MFAILLSDRMDPFYQNISSFPTVVFTFLLGLCVVYWLFAVVGVVDVDVLDFADGGAETGAGSGSDAGGPNAVAGLLMRLNLTGVPVTIVLTFVSLVGWLVCYYTVYLLFPLIPGRLLEYLAGIPIVAISMYAGAFVTGYLIRPLRPLFGNLEQDETKPILGQTAVVRTSEVTSTFGEAVLEDGGAGLILKVRASGDSTFKQGDRVVLFDRNDTDNTYRVVSEQEFNGM